MHTGMNQAAGFLFPNSHLFNLYNMIQTSVKNFPNEIFSKKPIEDHPLFLALPGMNNAQIMETALQIYHVVLNFPRFISALLTNIPDYKTRMPLVDNLFEEHGRLNEAYVHSETYRQFLLGIGLTSETIIQSKPIIPVVAYNRAVIDLCLHYPFTEGLAAVGIIEEIVARVSPIIGRFAKERFSDNKDSLFHFTSHETLDITHANEIYELTDQFDLPEHRECLARGFELGMYYHSRLYTDILEHVSMMHSA